MVVALKAAHTLIWAFFVAAIGAIWLFAWRNDFTSATAAIGIVAVEVVVLSMNDGVCPIGPLVARYTDDRRPNFDIYLPMWLAARTKPIFGALYVLAIAATLLRHYNVAG
uniref:hypothetical protein n=1 Tax=Sphingomonas bacterium TaxID=1895847 RepID=UPI00261BA416|nr:hypothetical protein [Sphingomonas bacterium]